MTIILLVSDSSSLMGCIAILQAIKPSTRKSVTIRYYIVCAQLATANGP